MTDIGLKIVLQAPTLLAATPPASNLTETLLVIPGNAIRGLLARRYLDLGRTPTDETFQRLFIAGHVRFGFARVAGAQPIPLSARSCKYDGGFLQDDGHGMLDLLLAGADEKVGCQFVISASQDTTDHRVAGPDERVESPCGQTIDYFQGFWDPIAWRRVPVHTRLITRTAIDPTRGTARNAQLYSQRVLEEGQVFLATVEAPEGLAPHLERLLHEPYTARLGRGSSRGQGWAEVSSTTSPAMSWDDAEKRFQQFRQKEGKAVLVVTLLSDSIFQDAYLRDTTAPSSADLASLGIRADEWEPHPTRAFMDIRMIFGFDGEPLYLPRQPRLAVAAGSVFSFRHETRTDSPRSRQALASAGPVSILLKGTAGQPYGIPFTLPRKGGAHESDAP